MAAILLEAALGMMGAPRRAMAETLTKLDAEFGGVRSYLNEQGGIDDETLRTLRAVLVELLDDS